MSEIIPFNAWSKARINGGFKVCTSRHKKYLNDPRVYYITPKLPWWIIKRYFFMAEGAADPTELQNVINSIYSRVVPDDEEFYVHFGDFKEMKT